MSDPETASAADLRPHGLSVALLHPQIAPNTGNVGRLCVATGTALHLVRPLGFVLTEQSLRRSAMDYWPRLRLTVHDDDAAFAAAMTGRRMWYFDSAGRRPLWEARFHSDDVLVFGSETRGIDPAVLRANPDYSLRIPQVPSERCLNLSTAVGAALYEALRQLHDPLSGRAAEPFER
jgi:tRNA (cytidine/uridine-2'-O-)-methyltransferase